MGSADVVCQRCPLDTTSHMSLHGCVHRKTRPPSACKQRTRRIVHGVQVRVRGPQHIGRRGGHQVQARHDALVGVDVALRAAQRRALRQPWAQTCTSS